MLAQAYLESRRFEDAEKDATAVLEVESGNLKALNRRSIARLGHKIPDVDGARADLIKLRKLGPDNKEVS